MTDEIITLVTVTIVDADSQSACASSYVNEYGDTLESVIEEVKAEAMDAFTGDSGGHIYRVIVNVNKVPMPTISGVIVHAEVPQGGSDAVVTATISA